jgi:queuosine precursor transporter
MIGYLALALFAVTIPAANWLIGNVGIECIPNGPCLIPVGLGLMAPSGVLMVGAALVLRDIVHERMGIYWAIAAVLVGGILSAFLAPPSLVIASTAAFLLAEGADLVVYTPLRKRQIAWAVLLSGIAGAVIDSAVFLWLAFGSISLIEGQIIGKLWMSLAAAVLLLAVRKFRQRDPAAA